MRLQRTANPRPLGVTLIALYELFLVGLIVYRVWTALASYFARSSPARPRSSPPRSPLPIRQSGAGPSSSNLGQVHHPVIWRGYAGQAT